VSALRRSLKPARTRPLRRTPLHAKRRDTGPSRKVRLMIVRRDGYCCVACGIYIGDRPFSIQHRVARGQGGTNSPSNLVVLCGSGITGCHGRCEQRDREYQARGYWLESWQDPAAEPVMVCGPQGGATVWLSADGSYVAEAAA
jgi:hypothetical protein